MTTEVAELPTSFSTQVRTRFDQHDLSQKLDLKPLRRTLSGLDQAAQDYTVPLKDVKLHVNGGPTGVSVEIDKQKFGLTPWSMAQLGQRIDTPASFLHKLHQNKQHDLLRHVLKEMQEVNGDEVLQFRTVSRLSSRLYSGLTYHQPIVRGILTESYKPTDNIAVVDSLAGFLDKEGWSMVADAVDHDVMALRLVNLGSRVKLQTKANRKVGDAVFGGILIQNSEVGRRSLSVSMFQYRLVCANGMILPKDFYAWSRRHTGDASEDFTKVMTPLMESGFDEMMTTVMQKTQLLTEVKYKPAALERKFTSAVDNVEGARPLAALFHNSRTETVEALMLQATKEAKKQGVLPRLSAWNAVNALTQLAQPLPVDARQKVETLAGHWLMQN